MKKIETIVKEYSSKKLKEIIEQQAASYSETFIDHAKDELIKRGESFQSDAQFEKEFAAMSDNDLKSIVETDWDNYYLEYLESARKEYLKRGFRNQQEENASNVPNENKEKNIPQRYPVSRIIATLMSIGAWVSGAIGIIAGLSSIALSMKYLEGLIELGIGVLTFLVLMLLAESIKILIDIEENTRKAKE